MLYRNPEPTELAPFPGLFARLFASLSAARRRRRTDLDLLSLSPHLKRDLGVDGMPLSDWRR